MSTSFYINDIELRGYLDAKEESVGDNKPYRIFFASITAGVEETKGKK